MEDFQVDAVNTSPVKDYSFGLEGVNLMYQAETVHHQRIQDLDKKQQELNDKLMAIKDHLKRSYKHMKTDGKELLDLSDVKHHIIKLWNEWKEDLKNRDPDEYNNLKTNLDDLDFSKLTLEHLDDKLIPELEKVQRHFEFKYQKIPNELRMFIELFTILVEILKEFPKKYSELNSHINRSIARG